uniref:Alternative protein TOP2B n=1 Tax=Homo sapiens TaxID=9606 RepID=L8E8K5_HUMAN|nr:alternative protein TOP2B [Homo sapiens]
MMNPSQKVIWKKQNLWLFQEILCLGEQQPKDLNTHLISQKKRMMMLMMMMMTIMI